MSTQVTLRGRLVKEPEIRYSQKGNAVTRFTIVCSRRVRDPQTGEWSDADTSYYDCVAFGQLAEGIAEQEKGTALIVQGTMAQESWTDKEGQPRKSWKVTTDDAAVSLRSASAKVTKSTWGKPASQPSQPAEDPWASDAANDSAPPF